MKLSRVIFIIAAIIVGVWLIGLMFRIAAWLISGLFYIAAIIVIIGIVRYWWETRKKSKVIEAEIVDSKKK